MKILNAKKERLKRYTPIIGKWLQEFVLLKGGGGGW